MYSGVAFIACDTLANTPSFAAVWPRRVNDEEVRGHVRATDLLRSLVGEVKLRVCTCVVVVDASADDAAIAPAIAEPSSKSPPKAGNDTEPPVDVTEALPTPPHSLDRRNDRTPQDSVTSRLTPASLELTSILPDRPDSVTPTAAAAAGCAACAAKDEMGGDVDDGTTTEATEATEEVLRMSHRQEEHDQHQQARVSWPSPPQLTASPVASIVEDCQQRAGLPGKDKGWKKLTQAERVAAKRLGFDEVAWEEGETPPACMQKWRLLSAVELEAAQTLGYTQVEWDAELEEGGEWH